MGLPVHFVLVATILAARLLHSETHRRTVTSLPAIYGTKKEACFECFRAYPSVTGVGSDRKGCKVGQCFLHDPYTQPAGGVIGTGPDWNSRKIDYCITRDNVSWFTRCETVLQQSAASLDEAAFACEISTQTAAINSYTSVSLLQHGLHREPTHFTSIATPSDDATETIQKVGPKFFDSASAFDSDHEALASACRRVHRFFTCVGSYHTIIEADVASKGQLVAKTKPTIDAFSEYCKPLFQHPTHDSFCAAYPLADACAVLGTCASCTKAGGAWCAGSQKCVPNGSNAACSAQCEAEESQSTTAVPTPEQETARAAAEVVPTAPPIEVSHMWWWEMSGPDMPTAIGDLANQRVKQGRAEMFAPVGSPSA